MESRSGWLPKENDIKAHQMNGVLIVKLNIPNIIYPHAAYAYYTQPHDDCAVVCLDSIGEFEILTHMAW